jgi:hypothetical protein
LFGKEKWKTEVRYEDKSMFQREKGVAHLISSLCSTDGQYVVDLHAALRYQISVLVWEKNWGNQKRSIEYQ